LPASGRAFRRDKALGVLVHLSLLILLLAGFAQAGILISRSESGLVFSEAAVITVNGKDRVLSLGAQPKIAGPVGRLAAFRLGGALLKDGDAATMAAYEAGGDVTYLLPQGAPKDAAGEPGAIWRTAKIAYRKSPSDKAPAEVSTAAFVAFLPAGAEALAKLCMDSRALELIGGKGKAFAAQVELISAAVKTYASNPAMGAVERYVEEAMRQRHSAFESGAAGVDALEEGLRYAALSLETYPAQPEQERLRKSLAQRKEWLDRRVAILRAFEAAGHWDAFLLGYRDFEKYQSSFPEMAEKHGQALKESLQLHRAAARERMAEGEHRAAWRAIRLASARQPSDTGLQKELSVAWTEYSRRNAVDKQSRRKQLNVGQREAITQALHFATRYKEQNKLEDALKSVGEAEAIDPESLPALLKKAEVLGAMRETQKALATLDEYDLRAVDEERQPAVQLRNELLFQLVTHLRDSKRELEKAWSEGNYHRARALAAEGLRAREDDPDLLYYAGTASLATRQPKDSRLFLARYLDVSNTLDANPERRAAVRRLLSGIADAAPPEQEGEANWLSGMKLPPNVYYCPISLAFQPRIDRIEASNKLKTTFEWDGGRLKSIVPVFERNERVSGEKKIAFTYSPQAPQVASLTYEDEPVPSGATPDEAYQRSSMVILNNPYIDPNAVAMLTGKNLAVGVAGNQFFHPFVWEKIHYFQFVYDENGRVKQARQLPDRNAAPGDLLLEFDWNGMQLSAIRGYRAPAAGGGRQVQIYERSLQYQGGRLLGEEIRAEGKTSRIKYIYSGDKPATAECDKDTTLDGRSREVAFQAMRAQAR
jgi:hypothetical protein